MEKSESQLTPTIVTTDQNIRKLHIGMLTYSFYEGDARVSRYAETLARRGDVVDVLAIGKEGQSGFDKLHGVNVFRIQKRERNEKGKLQYLLRLSKFLIKSSVILAKLHRKSPYDVIHVHSVPDFEVFAAWYPKLTRAGIILDIHDIVPEFYAAKFRTGKDSIFYKLLIFIEKCSTSFADRVIISNHIWQKTLCRSVDGNKCAVVMNYPDPNVFYKRPRQRTDDHFIMMYPGTLNWHQGLDIAIHAFKQASSKIPHAQLHIYGEGDQKNNLATMIRELNLQDRVFLFDSIPKEQIADVMSQADLGIVPKRNDSFGGEAFSTKTLEFMLLGVPLLVAGTKIDRYYFNDSIVKFFEPENETSMGTAMIEMVQSDDLRKSMIDKAQVFVEQEYDWEIKKQLYFNMVDELSMKSLNNNKRVQG
jgi:glycosyltransferase involved in cell wall biosynthesis